MSAWLRKYPAAVGLSMGIAGLLAAGSLVLFGYLYYFAAPLTLFSL
jgi:hypothetical protein